MNSARFREGIARRQRRQGGVGLIEFSIAGVASLCLMICTVQMGLAMWTYHSLCYAVRETNRYVSFHGRSCVTGSNSCGIFVSDVVTKFKGYAPNIPDSNVKLTLTSNSGNTVITCNPLSSCAGYTTTQWPATSHQDNYANANVYVSLNAATTVNSMIVALWYGWSGKRISTVTLSSTSKVQIVF